MFDPFFSHFFFFFYKIFVRVIFFSIDLISAEINLTFIYFYLIKKELILDDENLFKKKTNRNNYNYCNYNHNYNVFTI